MKRFLASVLIVVCLTTLAACSQNTPNTAMTTGTAYAATTTTEGSVTPTVTTSTVTTSTTATSASKWTGGTVAATTVSTASTSATTTSTTAATTVATTATTLATTIATTATTVGEDTVSAEYDALCQEVELLFAGMENSLPALFNTEITAENISYYLGVDNIDLIAGVACEPMMSSIAFSVCLIQVADEADVEGIKADIENNVDPRKWCCVEAENVIVDSIGSKIVLIMCNEPAEAIHANFEASIQ